MIAPKKNLKTNRSTSHRVSRWGNGVAVRIPKEILATTGMQEDDEVIIFEKNGKIIIEKTFRHKTLKERMAGYTGTYSAEEPDWGKPVGKEAW